MQYLHKFVTSLMPVLSFRYKHITSQKQICIKVEPYIKESLSLNSYGLKIEDSNSLWKILTAG